MKKSYKYQALVKLHEGREGGQWARLGHEPHRMVLRGQNHDSGQHQVFTVLVSCDDDRPFRPRSESRLVTLHLAGEDVTDYIAVGDHFSLWLGHNLGEGVVTRRMFL
jgi:hypothetical protein